MRAPTVSIEECARRGEEWYEKRIRPLVEENQRGRIVAIDIHTGGYEIGDTMTAACAAIAARLPEAETWCIRIGHRAVCRFGYLSPEDTK